MLDPRLPTVPDDWTVWAFSDTHGVTSGLIAALQAAGLLDTALHWVAPARTALVGCGDYLDRGRDVAGLLALLRRLQAAAAAAGSAVLLARGNHEAMPLMVRAGAHEWLATWLEYGGDATVEAFGCRLDEVSGPESLVAHLDAADPGLFAWLAGLPQAVRWRDVLFVHGGLPPDHAARDLGISTDEHLWIRSAFFDTPWDAPEFAAYRAEGIGRVVFGHTPQWSGATLYHAGRSLGIDTNAVGNPRMPSGAVQEVTLLGLAGDGRFERARIVTVPTRDAPERMAHRRDRAGDRR
jgi:diadenosine tetraphosphatase ApaH/serine/threonine PP2A family protein phosphatase